MKREPRAKRILIIRNAYAWQFGGAERLTFNFALALKKLGYKPVVATRVPELRQYCREANVPVFTNIWLQNRGRKIWPLYCALYPVLIAQYLYAIIRHRVQLVVCCSRDDQIFATFAAALLGRPSIWIDHADMKHIVKSNMRVLGWSYKLARRLAAKIVVVSKAERTKIFENLTEDHDKFVLIQNGASRPVGQPLPRGANDFIVAYVGRLEEEKGMFELLEAAKKLAPKFPNLKFWLAGKGRAEAVMLQEIKDKGLGNVRLLGQLDDIAPVLLAADLFVYPTHHDASPLAPAEALLAGVPVVASDIGGIPEMIDESCGRLFPVGDASKLADTIGYLVQDPALLAQLKRGAMAKASEVDFDSIVERLYLPLFEEVLSK